MNEPTDSQYRNAADAEYGDEDIDIDGDAVVSRGDSEGAYVQAWVWVDKHLAFDAPNDPTPLEALAEAIERADYVLGGGDVVEALYNALNRLREETKNANLSS